MKKYLSLLIVFLMVFVLGNQIAKAENGEEGSSTDSIQTETSNDDQNNNENRDVKIKRGELRKEFETKREEFKKQIETVRAETKTKMEALREGLKNEKDTAKAKIKELRIQGRERALERFDNAVVRMTELKDRINAQIIKLEAKEVNVINAKNFVNTAETKLTTANNKVAEINALLVISINELTLENKTKLVTLTKETQTLIVESHTALKEAVKSLRAEVKTKIENKINDDIEDDTN